MIKQEDLFFSFRPKRPGTADENGIFLDLLKMTEDYKVTDAGRAEAFLAQARAMASYEEDSPIYDLDHYHAFVGYQEMDPRELHSYFSWRTHYRKGEKVPLYLGFMFLHAAELINLVGARDEQDAFDQLLRLRQLPDMQGSCPSGLLGNGGAFSFRPAAGSGRAELSSGERKRLDRIIAEFLISWGPPDPELIQAYCVENLEREWDNTVLHCIGGADDASIFRVISHLVERRKLNSDFMEKAGEDAWRVIARVFRRLSQGRVKEDAEDAALDGRQTGNAALAPRLLGERQEHSRQLFSWLPYVPRVRDGYQIEVSPVTSYRYQNETWYSSSYPVLRDQDALQELSELVRECERVLRRKKHYRGHLPDRLHNPELEKLIGEEYDLWIREKARRHRPEVHVDLSKLGAIRRQAAVTRDRLLEGTGDGEEGPALNLAIALPLSPGMEACDSNAKAAEAGEAMDLAEPADPDRAKEQSGTDQPREGMTQPGQEEHSGSIFNERESIFLRLLLEGDNGASFLREQKILPAVFVDAVNEKAYEEIGDSIVEEDGKGWRLVEDYLEETEELLQG